MSYYSASDSTVDSVISKHSYESWTRSQSDSETDIPYRTNLYSLLHTVIDNELTDIEKYTIENHYFENKCVSEIAFELNVNPSTVTRTISRAERKIEKFMKYAFYVMFGSFPTDSIKNKIKGAVKK